ncbi:MAG: homocysteine S-methyltransferase family protein, partial [Acidobacteria bacterium]|nr:homocysteine S-methyltransferase family protein [Acidobacteriota bacterium]
MPGLVIADIPIWDGHWNWWVENSSWQLWFNGIMNGLIYGMLALGIVLIYRSTKVINFAVGNMGMPAMGLMALLVVNYNFPYWIALSISLSVGLLTGAVTELAVIRRLFDAPRVIVLVATIGIAQLMQAILSAMPDVHAESGEKYPIPLGGEWDIFWNISLSGQDLTIIIVVPTVAIVLALFLNRTLFGQTVQASANNPDLARLNGINPKTISLFVWTIAGLLGAVAMILLAGRRGEATQLNNLGPITMTRALVAAVLAGMYSFPRAVVAGVAIGVLQTHVLRLNLDDPGLFDFLLFVLVVVAILFQSRGAIAEAKSSFAFVSKRRPIPAHLREIWWIRHFTHFGAIALLALGIIVPLLIDTPSRHRAYARIVAFSICAVSVSVITGWSGQVSLAQMTFAEEGVTLGGDTPEEVAAALGELDLAAFGANCSVGPDLIRDVVERMARVADLPIAAQPNAGLPAYVDGRIEYSADPKYFSDAARQIAVAGARLLGGCCGTTPEHIAKVRDALRGVEPLDGGSAGRPAAVSTPARPAAPSI